jgi:hypothetical protein
VNGTFVCLDNSVLEACCDAELVAFDRQDERRHCISAKADGRSAILRSIAVKLEQRTQRSGQNSGRTRKTDLAWNNSVVTQAESSLWERDAADPAVQEETVQHGMQQPEAARIAVMLGDCRKLAQVYERASVVKRVWNERDRRIFCRS